MSQHTINWYMTKYRFDNSYLQHLLYGEYLMQTHEKIISESAVWQALQWEIYNRWTWMPMITKNNKIFSSNVHPSSLAPESGNKFCAM